MELLWQVLKVLVEIFVSNPYNWAWMKKELLLKVCWKY